MKKIIVILLAMLALVGCVGKKLDSHSNKGDNNLVDKNTDNDKETKEDIDDGDWNEEELDGYVDDTHLTTEEQDKNQEIGKLEDGLYEVEVVYPYQDRLRFNVLFKIVDQGLDKDNQAKLSDAQRMPADDSNAVTIMLDQNINGKTSTYRHGIFILGIEKGVITSIQQSE